MSRTPPSARRSPSPGHYVPQAESLILPDGVGGGEIAELLEEFVHHPPEEPDYDADYHLRREYHKHQPWWKTPSPWWLLTIIPFTAVAMSATLAPKIEIYTLLACSVHRPDIFDRTMPKSGGPLGIPEFSRILIPTVSGNASTLSFSVKNATCASDPVVQAAVAKLSAVYATSNGILSCLTTGYWGSFSDRHGRTRLMGLSVIGLLFTDFNFIFTTLNFQHLPGGYWFMILGPIIEGSLGGITASVAAMHAYVADTTTESARSRTFSLSLGLLFTGMAIGPTLGGLLIRFTGKALSVFYAAAFVHLIYASLVWLVLPESLLPSQMEKSREKHDADMRDAAHDRELNPTVGALVRLRRLFTFLSPLSVFVPEHKELLPGENPLKRKKRDWSLTIVAAVYGLAVSVMGSYPYKFQYAAATFGWTSETLGYWLTLVGAARAVFLTVILPLIIKLFNPAPIIKPPNASTNGTETQPLLGRSSKHPSGKTPHSTAFDLNIARVSLFVDALSYSAMALAPTALAFTISSMLSSMGAGLNPAIQSVALSLYRRRGGTESGRLFGALSVVQALSSQILGPAVYGLVYLKTVATFPRTIFIMSMVMATLSFSLLAFFRLPQAKTTHRSSGQVERNGEDEEVGIASGVHS